MVLLIQIDFIDRILPEELTRAIMIFLPKRMEGVLGDRDFVAGL